jgi:rod shape-determining protein MreC
MRSIIKKALIGICCALFFFISASRLAFFRHSFLENISSRLLYPFTTLASTCSDTIDRYRHRKASYAELEAKYHQLFDDYIAMLDGLIAERSLSKIYGETKDLALYTERYNLKEYVIARITVKNITQSEHYFIVNRGSRDGITKDMVALFHNHIVGRVMEVHDWHAKVMLITDQRSKVSGYTSKSHAPGILQGYNTPNQYNFTYVSHLFKVDDNDLIISSGQGLIFPEGFCLGKITFHSVKDKELYHVIEVKPLISLQSLKHCVLVSPQNIKPF